MVEKRVDKTRSGDGVAEPKVATENARIREYWRNIRTHMPPYPNSGLDRRDTRK